MDSEKEDKNLLKDYLIQKNKNFIDDTILSFKNPVENATKSLIEILNPQNFNNDIKSKKVKNSPDLILIGDKIDRITNILQNQLNDQIMSKKNDFLKESQKDKEITLQEENNDLLRLLTKENISVSKKDEGISQVDGTGKGIMGTIFGGMLGGFTLKKINKEMLMNAVKFGLKKILLPLKALFAVFDFAKGFGNALEITGRDDFSAKLQAGLSSALSGLSFGLIDAKTISESLDKFQNWCFDFILHPIKRIKELAEKFNLIEIVDNALNVLSFGLIPENIIADNLTKIKSFFTSFFTDPFNMIKQWWIDLDFKAIFSQILNPLKNLKDSILKDNIFQPLVDWFEGFELIDFLGIGPLLQRVKEFKENMTNILSNPKKFIMSFFSKDKTEDENIIVTQKIKKDIRKDSQKYITPIPEQYKKFPTPSEIMKEKSFTPKLKKMEDLSSTNNLSITNSNTNNNILMDDMSVLSDDTEALAYAY